MIKLKNVVKQKAFLGLCLIIMVLINGFHAYAADGGSITLKLIDHAQSGTVISDVEFLIYKVGTVQDYGSNLRFYSIYEIHSYPQNAEDTEAVIKILKEKITGEPLQRVKTDTNGSLEFGALGDGIYFVMASPDNSYGEIIPFLIQLPYYETVNGGLVGPAYEVEVEPKAQPFPNESEKGTESSESETEDSNQDSESSGENSEHPEESLKTNNLIDQTRLGNIGEKNAGVQNTDVKNSGAEKTGDTSMIGFYLCIAVSSILVLFIVSVKMKGKEKRA